MFVDHSGVLFFSSLFVFSFSGLLHFFTFIYFFFFLRIRRPPSSTRTATLFPYTTLFRSPLAGAVGDADGALALEDHPFDVGVGDDGEVGTLARRAQIGDGGAATKAVVCRLLNVADAGLVAAIEVARAGDADILRCFDEHVAELEARARVRDAEWPVTAVDLVLAALIAFRPLEVGKHVLVGPAGIAELAPMVEVLALAADIDQPEIGRAH